MTFLPDVNVWLAATWARHAHHPRAKDWFDHASDPIALCRISQMGLLRLLTNPVVLGSDALDRSAAWRVLDVLQADPLVTWMDEPRDLDAIWRTMSGRDDRSHKLWTDDYLAAFAQAGRLVVVTFDDALARRHPSVDVMSPPDRAEPLGRGRER